MWLPLSALRPCHRPELAALLCVRLVRTPSSADCRDMTAHRIRPAAAYPKPPALDIASCDDKCRDSPPSQAHSLPLFAHCNQSRQSKPLCYGKVM